MTVIWIIIWLMLTLRSKTCWITDLVKLIYWTVLHHLLDLLCNTNWLLHFKLRDCKRITFWIISPMSVAKCRSRLSVRSNYALWSILVRTTYQLRLYHIIISSVVLFIILKKFRHLKTCEIFTWYLFVSIHFTCDFILSYNVIA